jgi:hypothetical protein
MSRYYSKRKKQILNTTYKEAIKKIKGSRLSCANGAMTIDSIAYKRGLWWLSGNASGRWTTTPIECLYFHALVSK